MNDSHEVDLAEFRAAVREAISGSAEDAVGGCYDFAYDQPLEETFPYVEDWSAWLMDGAPGDELSQRYPTPLSPEMEAIWLEEAWAEWLRLEDAWPCRVSKRTWDATREALRAADDDVPSRERIELALALLRRARDESYLGY